MEDAPAGQNMSREPVGNLWSRESCINGSTLDWYQERCSLDESFLAIAEDMAREECAAHWLEDWSLL